MSALLPGKLPAVSNLPRRRFVAGLAAVLLGLATLAGVCFLGVLLWEIARQGWAGLDTQFITSFPSRFPAKAGVKAALWGTVWLLGLTALFAIPIGVGAALWLEEYAPRNRVTTIIELNISNLAGVPSIVYGILGLALFVRGLGCGRSVLSGALTLSLLILPVIIVAAREALRAVPGSLRHAALALGATTWQTIFHHVLPAAAPGILTGIILALSRAMGETAPLVTIGALTYVAFVPASPLDGFTALPIQIFNWASRPRREFHDLAASGILVLLGVLLSMNALAIWLRQRSGRNAC